MSNINNMGGILFASILFVSEFEIFSVLNDTAYISIKNGHVWRELPIVSSVTAPQVSPATATSDTTYNITATIPLLRACLSDKEAKILRTGLMEGCILRCQDSRGYTYLYGSREYPLQGSLTEQIGKKRTDLSTYELKLTGKCTHPQLLMSEI